MPRLIDTADEAAIELGDLVEALETSRFDPADEECFAAFGRALRRLANNRRFLADLVVEELKQRCSGQMRHNQYGAQVILLYGGSSRFLLRANFWPATEDSVVRNSGTNRFFYDVPHDHNFSFLTVGYLGPGYWSDYYEYDYGDVCGYAGEKAPLRFVERSRLSQGKVMLYRAHRDVHSQLPPDEMSVSINILGLSQTTELKDQYRFDLERREVDAVITRSSIEPLLALAAQRGGNGLEVVESFAAGHPSERIRLTAVHALAGAAKDLEGRLAVYEDATNSPSPVVRQGAARAAARLSGSRSWIEGGSGAPAQLPA